MDPLTQYTTQYIHDSGLPAPCLIHSIHDGVLPAPCLVHASLQIADGDAARSKRIKVMPRSLAPCVLAKQDTSQDDREPFSKLQKCSKHAGPARPRLCASCAPTCACGHMCTCAIPTRACGGNARLRTPPVLLTALNFPTPPSACVPIDVVACVHVVYVHTAVCSMHHTSPSFTLPLLLTYPLPPSSSLQSTTDDQHPALHYHRVVYVRHHRFVCV